MNRGTETEPHFIHVCISTFQQNPTCLGVQKDIICWH